jgi:hypothetical protein
MATKILVELTVDLSATEVSQRLAAEGAHNKLQALDNFIKRVKASIVPADIAQGSEEDGEVVLEKATGTVTVSAGGSAADETINICGVTFTAKASGAAGNQFNVSATAATQAENMRVAIAASADLAGIVTVARTNAVLTLSAVVPGVQGNALQLANVDLANVAVSSFTTEDTGAGVVPDLYLDLLNGDLATYAINR